MTENFATLLQIQADPDGPAGLLDGPYQIDSVQAAVRRSERVGVTRQDPWRALAVSRPLLVTPEIAWNHEIGDSIAHDLIWDALGDPGRGDLTGSTRTWRIGRPDGVRRFDFVAQLVEGGALVIGGAACSTCQIAIERGRIVTAMTEWVGRSLSTTDPAWDPELLANENFATSLISSVNFDDLEIPIFSAGITISRDIQAANLDLDGTARSWRGTLAVDILGRLALRLDSSDHLDLLLGQVQHRAITLTLVAGARTRTIELPRCAVECTERRLVERGQYEHVIEFAVLRDSDQDLAIVTSGPS